MNGGLYVASKAPSAAPPGIVLTLDVWLCGLDSAALIMLASSSDALLAALLASGDFPSGGTATIVLTPAGACWTRRRLSSSSVPSSAPTGEMPASATAPPTVLTSGASGSRALSLTITMEMSGSVAEADVERNALAHSLTSSRISRSITSNPVLGGAVQSAVAAGTFTTGFGAPVVAAATATPSETPSATPSSAPSVGQSGASTTAPSFVRGGDDGVRWNAVVLSAALSIVAGAMVLVALCVCAVAGVLVFLVACRGRCEHSRDGKATNSSAVVVPTVAAFEEVGQENGVELGRAAGR